MREILLRAYDKGRKEYFTYGNLFIAISKGEHPNKNEVYLDVINNPDRYKERFIIEQYTGLTDKNGKKVFEGDIIRKTNEGRHPQIFTANIHTNFRVNEEVYYSTCDHFTESCEYEIIGNIHDNSELLEV